MTGQGGIVSDLDKPQLPLRQGQSVWLKKEKAGPYLRGQRGIIVRTYPNGHFIFRAEGKRLTLVLRERDVSVTPIKPARKKKQKPREEKIDASYLALGGIPAKASTKRNARGWPGSVVSGGLPELGKRR